MIKRILVALDVDSDTPVATRFAVDIANRYEAEVVGLAVVDTGSIEADARGGGIGSMYYAEKLRESLTEETRAKAKTLIEEFERALQGTNVDFGDYVEEGVPFQRIVEDMKYHDLLVVGKHPHFFYHNPDHDTETLARVVKESAAPTFAVGGEYFDVEHVLIAYDGSAASARTMQSFVQMKPFGLDVSVELLHIHDGQKKESELMLRLAASYVESHGFNVKFASVRGGKPASVISDFANESKVDVVVAGAHSVSMLRKLAFGSTTARLIESCPAALFLHH